MRRVLITGGAGFVGSAVIRELLDHGVEVWAVVRNGFSERFATSRLAGLDVKTVECDMRDVSMVPELISERGFDAWYQFAWEGLRGTDLTDYGKQIQNIQWTMDAVTAAARMGCKKFIGSGSVSQYELLTPEGQAAKGDKHKVYKTAKLCCEYMGRSVSGDLGMEFIWPIITNIYGVGERSPRLINSMIRNLERGEHQALSEGNQLYDFIYITDAAKAFRLIGERGRGGRVYTIAQGCVQPLKHFLTVVRDVVAPDAELGFGELSFNGIYLPKECYDNTQLREDTGFQADIPFAEGIRRTAEWLRENEGKD